MVLITVLLFSIHREGLVNKSMNLFANNSINSTCKSSYSSDSGMICIDKEQEHF